MDFLNLSNLHLWGVFAAFGVFAYYRYYSWHYGVFKRLGIKGPTPLPILGTMLGAIKEGVMKRSIDTKKRYGKVVGTFLGPTPVMVIYDTEMLKQILVKDFSNFTNRLNLGFKDYPLRKVVVVLEDDHWKHVRSLLTPTFSSGKLRKMNGKILHCISTLCENLEKYAKADEIFEFRELTGAFAMDVIASTAFGLQIDSHNDPNNQFVKMGKKAFSFSFTKFSTILFFFFPFLMKHLSKWGLVSIFPGDAVKFFAEVVDRAMDERKTNEDDEVDFLQLMIKAHQDSEVQDKTAKSENKPLKGDDWSGSKGLSHEEVLAQGILFFLAGYDTTASVMALFGYELAVNPDIQDRLIEEIDKAMKDQKHVTFDVVQQMSYMDMCLNEALRMYPPGVRTDRVARNDVVINGVFIPKGMVIGIPIYALQNDPDVWPNPQKFDPQRFSPEAKESRDPLNFLPFGFGPRNCVGMRLALMELKMSMVHILQRFKFVVCEETQIPLKLDKLRMQAVNGIKLKVKKR